MLLWYAAKEKILPDIVKYMNTVKRLSKLDKSEILIMNNVIKF